MSKSINCSSEISSIIKSADEDYEIIKIHTISSKQLRIGNKIFTNSSLFHQKKSGLKVYQEGLDQLDLIRKLFGQQPEKPNSLCEILQQKNYEQYSQIVHHMQLSIRAYKSKNIIADQYKKPQLNSRLKNLIQKKQNVSNPKIFKLVHSNTNFLAFPTMFNEFHKTIFDKLDNGRLIIAQNSRNIKRLKKGVRMFSNGIELLDKFITKDLTKEPYTQMLLQDLLLAYKNELQEYEQLLNNEKMQEFKNELNFQQLGLSVKADSFKQSRDVDDAIICYKNFCNGMILVNDLAKKYDKEQNNQWTQLKLELGGKLKFYYEEYIQFHDTLHKNQIDDPELKYQDRVISLSKKEQNLKPNNKFWQKCKSDCYYKTNQQLESDKKSLKYDDVNLLNMKKRQSYSYIKTDTFSGRKSVVFNQVNNTDMHKSSNLKQQIFVGNLFNNHNNTQSEIINSKFDPNYLNTNNFDENGLDLNTPLICKSNMLFGANTPHKSNKDYCTPKRTVLVPHYKKRSYLCLDSEKQNLMRSVVKPEQMFLIR